MELTIRTAQQKLQALTKERSQLDDDRQDEIKSIAALEMVVKDLEDSRTQCSETKV
jgi:hypothetical protein